MNTIATEVGQRTVSQWVDYIQTLHARSIDLSLERVAEVWARMRPEQMPPVIAVAGTNGKGSSVSMLESIYRCAGYQTGRFTSPHLVRFNERICLNNIEVDDATLLPAFERVETIRGDVSLTYFEFNTLLALSIFCEADVDIMLMEVGMGGRLDSVNIVDNDLALITAIGLDHCAWLGDDVETIGVEKAGIIKPKGRAVIADPQAPASIAHVARQQQAQFWQANHDYTLETTIDGRRLFQSDHRQLKAFSGMQLPAAPAHQHHNMAGVIAAVMVLQEKLSVTTEQLEQGLQQQFLAGRLQLIEGTPPLLLDVSHNDASVMAMLAYIDSLQVPGKLHAVFGALADKRYEEAFKALKTRVSVWYLSAIEGERGQTAEQLSQQLFADPGDADLQARAQLYTTAEAAFEAANQRATEHDLIVIFGSFHIVGAIIDGLNR